MDPTAEARAFLTSRRAQLSPTEVGLPPADSRRRVRGLRRDEVAILAGVSSEYYARLERGRLGGVSPAVLNAVADALRLTTSERTHLFNLARAAGATGRMPSAAPDGGDVRPSIQRILDSMTTGAAYVTNSRFEIVAANCLARELLAPMFEFAARTGTPPSAPRFAFLDPHGPDFYRDWEAVSHNLVAALHAAIGYFPNDPGIAGLVTELESGSELFSRLWARRDVFFHRAGVKVFIHPVAGELILDFEVLAVPNEPGMALTVFNAAEGSEDARKLSALAERAHEPFESSARDFVIR